jgi:DUF4097 and DUF4098 domain-containing protein YvlB
MRHIMLTLTAVLLVLSPLAKAEEWSKTFNLTGKPSLKIETSDANIRVEVWDQNLIQAHITTEGYAIGEKGIRIIDRQTGDSVELEVRYPHHNFNFNIGHNHHRVDVEIHMPKEGRVDLRTGDGHIRLTGLKGEMELVSGDGHQDIDAVDGTLRAHAGDGHIRATGRFDGLDLSTGDGRIEATALAGSSLARNWNMHTGDGSVTLQLPENVSADVDLHTGDGHITVGFPISVSGRLENKSIRGKINGGGNLLSIHTGDGSIRLEKS